MTLVSYSNYSLTLLFFAQKVLDMLEFHPHGLTSAVGIGAVTDNKGILRVAIQALRAAGYSVPVTAFCLRCFR